ncbi:MAG: DUF1116 domain-containing protein [Proteobacteria bacterium]|nr:MAG: DUF1116 domain-containing protein [Pseudomonadota bacterium]
MSSIDTLREQANAEAFSRLDASDPVLVDVQPAGDVVPGMTPRTILTSGRPMPWARYCGGQRRSLIYGAIYEGLATDEKDAEDRFASGDITVSACHEHGCVGSVAGIYTASMPVFVVENRNYGNKAFCNLYEGASRRRLNYGAYDQEVHDGLVFLEQVIAPVIGRAVRESGGMPLKPIMQRAVRMGDELHSRNTAATILFARALTPYLFDLYGENPDNVRSTYDFLTENEYSFLRLSMAAAKATADAAHGVEGSSVVTAMTISCLGFALRISGLDGEWFDGPAAVVEAKLFEGFGEQDIEWIGGESHITETIGLGGFAQAAAFALQQYQGGSPEAMADNNRKMYDITVGENGTYQIPFFGYRGTPTGIDIFKVLKTGTTPMIDGGLAGRDGGQIGAGILRAPIECFQAAADAWKRRYET